MEHKPVLWREVLELLQPRPGGTYIDCTVGGGGHLTTIAAASHHRSHLLGIDADPIALTQARKSLSPYVSSLILEQANFAELAAVARAHGIGRADGILFDLGLSSLQLADPRRGFSFQSEGPLDMRTDPRLPTTAGDLLNGLPVEELAAILWRYGEERKARRIARHIVRSRPVETTTELSRIVTRALGAAGRRRSHHPATRTFQALRMAVNAELESLSRALPQAVELLKPGGRLCVISFHSLEDRMVKQFLAREARDCICPAEQPVCTCGHRSTLRILTRKPLTPSPEEVQENPRSRSARLRGAERI